MDATEAINWISEHFPPDDETEQSKAIRTALSALEKQIPKKPTYTYLGGENGCPICSWAVTSTFDGYIERKMNYCYHCGQKIDWSVTE